MPTYDELAARFKTDLEDLHAAIAAHEDGPLKEAAEDLAAVAHRALDRLHRRAFNGGVVIASPIPKPQ